MYNESKNAISLVIINRFNDRGSITSTVSETIDIDADLVKIGEVLPMWKWQCNEELPPIVKYYDGELLELEFNNKIHKVTTSSTPTELLEASCPENMSVEHSRVIAIRLSALSCPEQLPSWSEMYRKGSFNAITVNALSLSGTDASATRWFCRVFTSKENLFYLFPETVKTLENKAKSGNEYALFAFGRYHLLTQPHQNSTEISVDCFKRASDKGLAEATTALSIAYDYGDIGIVDRVRAKTLLSDALNAGCEFAAEYQIKKILYGLCGTDADPQQALKICDELIAKDYETYGKDGINPKWIYYKGCAIQAINGWTHGVKELQAAADAGLITAWLDVVIALSHNDQGELVDKTAYISTLRKGAANKSAICATFLAIAKVEDFDNMPKYKQLLATNQLICELEKCIQNGSSAAAETLGDVCYYGQYGIEEDNEKAFQYYAKGALHHSPSCLEKMFEMIHNHYIDKPQEFKDMIALYGTRNGSEKLLGETVMAYTYGRLTEYASEIEQYYAPIFDGDGNDDNVDDDGRFDAYV